MPTLEEIIQSSPHAEPEMEEELLEGAQVEPLDGPTFPEDVLVDRFPDTIYDQTPDSYLFKFIEALCGDAGAGILKKLSWTSRLKNEGEYIDFATLDRFYTGHFRFRRLKSELYEIDPDTEIITNDQLEEMERKDALFRRRIHHFLQAAQLGNSPEGLEEMGFAGSGIDVEVYEHYNYIFDKYSDLPLGLEAQGFSNSVNEFVLLPRLQDADGVINEDVAFHSDAFLVSDFTLPTFSSTASKPPTFSALLNVNATWVTGTDVGTSMIPDVERNMLDVVDRLRPVSALMSVRTMQYRYLPIDVDPEPFPTSERILMQRYVRGRGDIVWPTPDPTQGFWIEPDIEKQAPFLPGTAREFPVIFHTVDDIHAYIERALEDEDYNTLKWYGDESGFVPWMQYRSEKTGRFLPGIKRLFAFLRTTNVGQEFTAHNALAAPNTLLKLESRNR